MNKTFHSVWNASKQAFVAAAETVAAKGKPSSGVKLAAVVASLMGGLLGTVANAQTAPPPAALPSGGQVSAGQASISANGAHMVINQSSNRAAINWQTFNVGKDAHVQFQQPSAASVTLNRVMSADPSQIFGRISSNGQVILTNPAGVYFSPSSRVDVGSLVATTHGMSDADFMAGKNRFERNGSTASVVNEGEIKAALGGYIALLAPEVRNQGAIIAHMGTVALAAGEAIDLKFDSNNRLTSLRVDPSQIAALVDNRHAVQAPGGLVIISAQSMDRLVGGVVKNSGRIEANGLQQQGGRIMLSASHRVENTGSISANATAGSTAAASGPAGRIEISAPEVLNSGSISASGNASSEASASGTAAPSAASVLVQATHFTQTANGSIDLSGTHQGGSLSIQASGKVQLQGSVSVAATQDRTTAGAPTQGGQIDIAAQGDIEVNNATLDASGGQGGAIALRAKAPSQPDNPNPVPQTPDAPGQGRLAIMGNSTVSSRGRIGRGGSAELLGDHIELLDTARIDASGTTGGGNLLIGGDWQGGNDVYQATTLTVAEGVTIDASATNQGKGGKVVLWSTDFTDFAGQIASRGAGPGGNGGDAEVSGKAVLNYTGFANLLGSEGGQAGNLLLDPNNLYIVTGTGGSVTASSTDSLLGVSTLVSQLSGAHVTISTGSTGWQLGNVGLMTPLSSSSLNNLTINAARNIVIAADVNIGGKLTINAGNDFVMGTNLSNAAGVNITANGGFEKASTSGTSYLTGNITTSNTAITIAGNIQIANFNSGTIGLYSNGGNITLNSGTISRYSGTALDYAVMTVDSLYHGPSRGTVGSDIYLSYTSSSLFLGQLGISSVQYMLVGGGGGGGGGQASVHGGGGGGAGGVLSGTTSVNAGSSISVGVGAGGQGGAGSNGFTGTIGLSGGNSYFNGLSVLGGGGGGQYFAGAARTGSSGGGGAISNNSSFQIGASGTAGQGYAGGNAHIFQFDFGAGGGGGAGGVGGNSAKNDTVNYNLGGTGGLALSNSITGSSQYYGGGGGGGGYRSGVGGSGIGGSGGSTTALTGQAGVANTGSGGGGGMGNGSGYGNGGGGADGVVVVRYSVGSASSNTAAFLRLSAGNGTVTLGSSASGVALEVNAAGASTISGSVSGAVPFTHSGTGTLTISGVASYSGATTISSGNLTFTNNTPPSTSGFLGAGSVVVQPASSFTSAFNANYTYASTLKGLTLGKDGNTQAITMASALSIAGPISIYGGTITLNAGLTASGTNTITLKAGSASSISGTGFVNAGNLLLLGGGTITLNNNSNAIGTLAASGVGSLTYVDSDALTIGTLGSTNGVSATGAVNIGTRAGDLTLSQNVSTTLVSSNSAMVLNGGITTAAGTSTGGNIIVSGTPSVSVGAGSRATLYSGSISGSTGLVNLSGLTAGMGRFRYNADETTNFASGSWTNLGTGVYAVYREQPTASLSSTALNITYGDLLPSISATGLVNSDVSTYSITGRLNATSGNIRASATPYAITTDLLGLGYSAASGTGTLTVITKTLTLVDSKAASRVYNGLATASITSVGSLVGKVGIDAVTVGNTSATFSSKDVANDKTVTLSGVALGSTDAANYSIVSTATASANITPMLMTVTASSATKTYDGLAYAGGIGVTYSAFATGDTASNLTGGPIYSGNSQGTVDAGAYAITPSGLSSGNYTIQYQDGVLTVNPRQVTVTGLAANGKVYDGTANATVTNWGSVSTGITVGGLTEVLTLNHGTAAFASKNVAYSSGAVTSQSITATGYSLSNGIASSGLSVGKASNYVLTSASATTTATITPLALSINGVSINDKVYDGNTTATANGGNISKLGADVVSLVSTGTTGTFASADVAYNGAVVVAQPVTVSGFTLSGGGAGNYSLIQPTGLTATVSSKTVTLNSLSTTSKTYDGTTNAPLSSTPTLSGLVTGESLSVSGAATFASADAGGGIQVNVTGLTLADVAGAGGGKASNYNLGSTTATTTGTINRKILTISSLTADDKTYDGTTNVNITNWGSVSTGVTVGGNTETLTLNHGTASFVSKDVARNAGNTPTTKTVTASGFSLTNGTNGGMASNYELTSTSATTIALINPATLTVRANDDADFVTQTDARPGYNGVSHTGFVNGETQTSAGAFSGLLSISRNNTVTTGQGSYIGVLQPTGLTEGNYQISYANGNYTIVPADQLLVRVDNVRNDYGTSTTYVVREAKYLRSSDNTTIVDLTSSAVGSGINNNSIVLTDSSSGTANFDLGAISPVLSSAGKLKVGIYQVGATSITESSANFNNTINVVGAHQVGPKLLTPTVMTGASKTYDGTTNMTGLTVSSPALLTGDLVTMTTGGGLFASRNAGSQAYTVSNVALAGATTPAVGDDSANYYISNGTVTGTGSISQATLTLTAVADTKVYDGTTVTSKAVGVSGLMASDTISGLVQTFNNKNVTATTVQASGYTINDGNSGNNYTLVSNTATGTISQAPLGLTAVSDTRVYDRTTSSNKSVLVGGLVAGDSIASLNQSFLSKDVLGSDLSTMRVNTGYTVVDGGTANMVGNYAVTLNDAPGTITPASLIVSGITTANKAYDGTAAAAVNATGNSNLLGLIVGDTITFSGVSGAFADKHAGEGKTVTLNYNLDGADKANYSITNQATAAANITQRALAVSATGVSKVYDGGTGMTSVTPTSDKLTNDQVNISVIGSFTNASANINKDYTLTVIGITGDDARNYSLTIGSTFSGSDGIISKRPLTVTANSASKTYDGQIWSDGNGLTYSGVAGNAASGFASGEDASGLTGTVVWGGTAQGARNAATGANAYTLSASGYNTTGNYSFTYVPGTLTVNPASLTLSAVSETKVYDATTTSLSTVLVSGLQVGDTTGNLTQAFDSKAVGSGTSRLNVVASYTLKDSSNADVSGNYIVNSQAASGEITQRAIAIGGITASSKEYNGNDTAVVNTTSATGWIVGDSFSVAATGQFSDKHVSTNKVVTLASSYIGTDVGNYVLTNQASTTADITAKAITISGITAANKVYDGDTTVNVSGSTATGWVAGDSFSVTATGSFGDKHAGTGKSVNLNVSYSGDDIGNYIVTVPSTTTGNISVKPVTLLAPVATKVYDGSSSYVASSTDMAALSAALGVAGDAVNGITLTFADKNAAEAKSITASSAVVQDGNNGGNYQITYAGNSLSRISRAGSVSWVGGSSGEWFNPTNWAGQTVPDLANVETVVIPSGTIVNFNTTGTFPAGVVTDQPVSLLGLQGTDATLSLVNGTLNLGISGTTLSGLVQTGGALNSAGPLTFTGAFSQSAGTLSTTGSAAHVDITQATGPLSWSSISSGGNLAVRAAQIDFGQTTVGGSLLSTTTGVGAAGGVTQSAPVIIKGDAVFVADTGLAQDAALLANNDFQGTLSFSKTNGGSWQHVSVKDINLLKLGGVETDGDFKVSAGGDITQDSSNDKKIVVGGTTDLTAGGGITLDGPNNDFKGLFNAKGGNISIKDINDLILGDIHARGDLDAEVGNDMNQDTTGGKKIVVEGKTRLKAKRKIKLDGKENKFTKGVTVLASDYLIVGDSSKDVEEVQGKAIAHMQFNSLPGTGVLNASPPQPLVMSSDTLTSSSTTAATASANSNGVTVDVQNTNQQVVPLMVAVSLPKGASTVGTGFSFEMPESIKSMASADTSIQVTQDNGKPLPTWLRFDPVAMRFEATAVPDSALPMQLVAVLAGQRVTVLISERTE